MAEASGGDRRELERLAEADKKLAKREMGDSLARSDRQVEVTRKWNEGTRLDVDRLAAVAKGKSEESAKAAAEPMLAGRMFRAESRSGLAGVAPMTPPAVAAPQPAEPMPTGKPADALAFTAGDRKSTRLNSSHVSESRMPSSA